MIDEKSGSRFWKVKTVDTIGGTDSFIVQTCASKDADYVHKILESVHPEYEEISIKPTERPKHLERCYGDP